MSIPSQALHWVEQHHLSTKNLHPDERSRRDQQKNQHIAEELRIENSPSLQKNGECDWKIR
jgi:hypothetical protein